MVCPQLLQIDRLALEGHACRDVLRDLVPLASQAHFGRKCAPSSDRFLPVHQGKCPIREARGQADAVTASLGPPGTRAQCQRIGDRTRVHVG